jgi:hypothetical protein
MALEGLSERRREDSISVSSSSPGICPASDSLVAFTITMTCITRLLLNSVLYLYVERGAPKSTEYAIRKT